MAIQGESPLSKRSGHNQLIIDRLIHFVSVLLDISSWKRCSVSSSLSLSVEWAMHAFVCTPDLDQIALVRKATNTCLITHSFEWTFHNYCKCPSGSTPTNKETEVSSTLLLLRDRRRSSSLMIFKEWLTRAKLWIKYRPEPSRDRRRNTRSYTITSWKVESGMRRETCLSLIVVRNNHQSIDADETIVE